MDKLDRITVNPEIMGGRPCVRGMRITAGLVINLMANRMSVDDILCEYPTLEEEDIHQCLQYAARLAENREVNLAVSG